MYFEWADQETPEKFDTGQDNICRSDIGISMRAFFFAQTSKLLNVTSVPSVFFFILYNDQQIHN